MKYCEMSKEALLAEQEKLVKEYKNIKAEGMKLDISRGKPCTDQLNLSDGLLTILKGMEDCIRILDPLNGESSLLVGVSLICY